MIQSHEARILLRMGNGKQGNWPLLADVNGGQGS